MVAVPQGVVCTKHVWCPEERVDILACVFTTRSGEMVTAVSPSLIHYRALPGKGGELPESELALDLPCVRAPNTIGYSTANESNDDDQKRVRTVERR